MSGVCFKEYIVYYTTASSWKIEARTRATWCQTHIFLKKKFNFVHRRSKSRLELLAAPCFQKNTQRIHLLEEEEEEEEEEEKRREERGGGGGKGGLVKRRKRRLWAC